MYNEFLDLLLKPQIGFVAETTPKPQAKIEVRYPFFIPGVSETELEWGYVHESELNSGERLSRAEPEDWNRIMLGKLEGENETDPSAKVLQVQRLCLPIEQDGRFHIKARLRFYPYGRDKRVVGTQVVLPEPERESDGTPKEPEDLWLRAETEGEHLAGRLQLYPPDKHPKNLQERYHGRFSHL
jgi:hypothetical protein